MQSANDFKVDITDHSTIDRFIRGGGTEKITRVVFYVGKFGPFTEEFKVGEDDGNAIQARIQRKVQTLQQLNTAAY